MKKSKNIYRALHVLLAFIFFTLNSFGAAKADQMYYQIKIYRIAGKTQEDKVDAYLKDAFFLHSIVQAYLIVGVFKPVEADTAFGKMVYVFIPFKTIDQFAQLSDKLDKDKAYATAGKDFLDAPYNNPPFVRYESILLKAFTNMPEFRVPKYLTNPSERIYELRSYESATEAKAAKKIQMFNEGGEIGIFESVGSNAVFYGKVLMGARCQG